MATVNIAGLAQLAGSKHTVTGLLAEISADLELGSPDSLLLENANKFTTLTVTDSGEASAVELSKIYELVTARVKISGITTVTGNTQEVAALYAAQKAKEVTGLGNEAVTLEGGTIDAATLNAIDKATTGTITVQGDVTLRGSLKDVSAALKAKAKAITLEPGAQVVLTDTSLSGASAFKMLKALSSLTSGEIDASSLTTLQGSAADIAALYAAGISNLDNTAITLTGATVAAADLLNVDEGTDVDVNAASVKTIKGSADEVADVFAAAAEGTIDGLRENTKITLVGTEANAQDLLAVDAGTTAKLSVAKLKTVTGTAADVAAVYEAQSAKTISGLGNEKVILEGEASASDLAAINAATTGQIDASNVTELTGGLSEINTLLSTLPKEISGLGTQSIVLTDTALTTAQLEALDLRTTGEISLSPGTTLTGPLANLAELTEIIGDDTVLTLTDTRIDAADLLALRGNTSNAINADSVTSITGTLEEILAIQAADGISLKNLIVSLSGETAAADLLSFIEGINSPIDVSDVTALTGSLDDIKAVLNADYEEITGLAADLDLKIEDSAASLLNPDNAAILADASVVTVTGNAAGTLSIAEQAQLAGLTTDDTWTYSIEDSAANLLNPDNVGTLAAAGAVNVTGNAAGTLSIADQARLAGLTTDDSWTYSIEDSAENLLNTDNADILADAAAVTVTVTGNAAGTLSIAEHVALTALTTDDTWTYSIQDSATNLLNTGNVAPIFGADTVSVTGDAAGTLSIADHASLTALTTNDTWDYSIQDSAANLLNPDNAETLAAASVVTLTDNAAGTLSIAQQTQLAALTTDDTWTYSIQDSAENLLNLDNADAVAGASALSLLGDAAGALTLAQYDALAALLDPDYAWDYSIADTVANLLAADQDVLDNAESVTLVGDAGGALTVAEIGQLATLIDINTLTYSLSDSQANLWDGAAASDFVKAGVAVNVTGLATVAGLAAIDTANGAANVTYGTLNGSPADLTADAQLNDGRGQYVSGSHPIIVDGEPSVFQLNTINTAAGGIVTATISGAAADLAQLIPGDNAYTVTVEGPATLDQLATIDAATTVALNYGAVSGTADALATDSQLNGGSGKYVSGSHDITVIDEPTVLQLNIINAATSGVISASISGTAAVLSALVEGNNAYTITVSAGPATAAQLNTINAATSVLVDATAITAITGTAAQFESLLSEANAIPATIELAADFAATVSGTVTVDLLNALNTATEGVVTATISGTAEALSALDAGNNAYTITVNGAATAAQLTSIDAATTVVVNASAVTEITGSLADFAILKFAAEELVSINLAANVNLTITDASISVADANSLDAFTSGTVTATLSNTDADELELLIGTDNAYTITVEGTATAAQLNTINAVTTEAVTATAVTAISGSTADFSSLLEAAEADPATISLADNFTATVDDAASVTLLNALNAATSGVVTASITGTAEDLAQLNATDGVNAYSITVTGAATVAQLVAIYAATSNAVNAEGVSPITGTAAEFNALLLAVTDNEITLGNFAAVVDGEVTVDQLNALDAITDGIITAALSGTADELDALAENDNAYTIEVTDTATLAQLVSIDAATRLDLEYAGITGVRADFFSSGLLTPNAFDYVKDGHAVEVTDGLTVDQANDLDALTTGTVTATLSGTATELDELAENNNAYTIEVTDTATLAQLASIDAATSVPLTYAGITGVSADFFEVVDGEEVLTSNALAYVKNGHAVTVTDGLTVAQANILDGLTDQPITASITETDAAILATLTGINAYSITVQGLANAADLIIIDAATTVPVNAEVVTIVGSHAELLAVQTAAQTEPASIELPASFQILVGALVDGAAVVDSISVADANVLEAFAGLDGGVIAAITETDAATLATLSGTQNYYNITVEGAATAAQLIAIDGAVRPPIPEEGITAINATGVTSISGSAADIETVLAAAASDTPSISLGDTFSLTVSGSISVEQANAFDAATTGIVTATISTNDAQTLATLIGTNNAYTITVAGEATAAQLIAIDGATTSQVNATGVTAISGTAEQFDLLLAAKTAGQITLGNFAATVDGEVTVDQLYALNAITTGVITATIEGTAEVLDGLSAGDNALTITITDPASLAQLATIDAATTVDLIYSAVSDGAEALINDAKTNFGTGTYVTATVNVTVTDEPTVDQLNTINNATTGIVTASITGTAAQLGQLIPGDNNYTVKVTGPATLEQLDVIDFATTGEVIYQGITGVELDFFTVDNGTTLTAKALAYVKDGHAVSVTGSGLSVAQANTLDAKTDAVVTASISETDASELAGLNGTNNAYTISVTGEASAADLLKIDAATTVVVNANGVTPITGTLEEFTTLLAATPASITLADDYAAVVTDSSISVADAKLLDAATGGVVTATITETDAETLVGLVPEFTILAPLPVNAYTITVEGTATAEQLNIINGATSVAVDASAVTDITGNAEQLAALLEAALDDPATISLADSFTATVDDAASVTLLNALNAATTGVVTADITGTAEDLAQLNATDGVNAYSITVTGAAATVAQLVAIYAATSSAVNAQDVSPITGTATEFDALRAAVTAGEITLGNFEAEVTGPVTVEQLNALDAITTGEITATLIGTADVLDELAESDNAYTITVEGDATLAQLASIDAATSIDLTYAGITGVNADFFEADSDTPTANAQAYVNEDHAVEVTDGLTVAQANTLDNLTTGTITATLSGTAAELDVLLENDNAYTITVVGDATLAQLVSIDAATNLELTYAGITGVSTDFFEADSTTLTDTALDYVTADHAVKVTGGALTAGQASALAGSTTGLVTAAVSDTAEALAALAAGDNNFSINVTDIVTLSQLASIDAATAGTITYGAITGSATELYLDARQNGGTGVYVKGEHAVTVVGPATVLQLNTIDAAVSGIVTATITGTAAELAGLLPGTNAYTIHLTDTPTPEQWAIIQASTSIPVSVTVNGTVGDDVLDYSAYSTGLTINGDAGNDIIIGGAGNDVINGGEGVDDLYGGDGDDLFIVGENAVGEAYDGGDGTNTVRVTGTGINLTDDHLPNIQHIEIAEGASAFVNLAQADLVTAGVYFIVDTAEAILDALEDGAVLGAEGVETNDLTVVTLTVAEAGALQSAGVTITAGYNIVDSAAAILDALEDGAVEGALSLATNDEDAVDLTVEEAGKLQTAGVSFTNGYNIVDTAANLLITGNPAVFADAGTVSVKDAAAGNLSIEQHAALVLLTDAANWTYNIVDTAAKIQALVNSGDLDGLLAGADAVSAEAALTLSVEQKQAINLTSAYNIVGSAAVILDALEDDIGGVLANADEITTNDTGAATMTVAQASTLLGASVIIANGYNISDTAQAIQLLLAEEPLSDILADAEIVIADAALTLTVAQKQAINVVSEYNIVDSASAVAAADPALLNSAQGVTVNGTADGDSLDFSAPGLITKNGLLTINAGAGDDTLIGSSFGDTLRGGTGADQLSGGAGNDTFVYTSAADSTEASMDSIKDFAWGDTIDLSNIPEVADTVFSGSDGSLGAAQTSAAAAFFNDSSVYLSQIGANTYLFADANGNGAFDAADDLVIELVGVAWEDVTITFS